MPFPRALTSRSLLFAALATSVVATSGVSGACELPTTLSHSVTAVLDSRSLQLDDGSELRLAAIIGPTPYDTPAAAKNWPAESEALMSLGALALNRNVAVSLERQARDRYGRLIGHALIASSSGNSNKPVVDRWLQAQLVRAGQARVALTPEIDEACAKLLLTLEAAAEADKRGLWRNAAYSPKRAEDVWELRRYRSTFQIVEGVVASVSVRRSAVYLNFGENWRTDFTAKLSRGMLRRAKLEANMIQELHKSAIRIRGWIERRNGPLITVWRLDQIETLSLLPAGETRRYNPPNLLTALRQSHPGKTKK